MIERSLYMLLTGVIGILLAWLAEHFLGVDSITFFIVYLMLVIVNELYAIREQITKEE